MALLCLIRLQGQLWTDRAWGPRDVLWQRGLGKLGSHAHSDASMARSSQKPGCAANLVSPAELGVNDAAGRYERVSLVQSPSKSVAERGRGGYFSW